ncbi:hypothetical protein QT13_01745 [Pectobacterium brasiliense]|uniref:hypothetical protein n=1 Tax=Pectobacterium brasiliense TaxID=180957 RepID=UPI00057E0DB5|nr:hypothetical protein [Pectobacterium brasiliense]KHS76990.1 hypothetical protein QT13_01745 [Pectobacterium brasiliense]
MSKKDHAVVIMQEYFPNGGRDFEGVCELFDAIRDGKIPHVHLQPDVGDSQFEILARPLIRYIAENHHPHTHIIIDSQHAELSEGVQSIQTGEYIKG